MKTQYDPTGVFEIPDPTPIELPIGMKRPETLQETMARMLRQHFLIQKQNEGFETPDQADDFDIDDEHDGVPWSPWEERADDQANAIALLKAETNSADQAEPAVGPPGTPPPPPVNQA